MKKTTGILSYIDVKNRIAVIKVGRNTYFCDLNSNPQLLKLGMFPNVKVSVNLKTDEGSCYALD